MSELRLPKFTQPEFPRSRAPCPLGLAPVYTACVPWLDAGLMLNLKCNILHLEDDDNDSLFFQRALTNCQFAGAYRRVSTVDAAIRYLNGTDEFSERRLFPAPDVLVMDSALTGTQTTDDLLKWMEGKKEFRSVVQIMLTGGVNPTSERSWKERGISAVLPKGITLADFATAVEEVLRRCVA